MSFVRNLVIYNPLNEKGKFLGMCGWWMFARPGLPRLTKPRVQIHLAQVLYLMNSLDTVLP